MAHMPMQRDLQQYHRAIAQELQVAQDQIRNLIGSAHWQKDGEHKEAILRKTLRAHVPETIHVGQGFVCYPDGARNTSHQIDILLTARDKPTLFKDGEQVFVTPDAVEAFIEVKTALSLAKFAQTVASLTEEAERIRHINRNGSFTVGLFVFNEIDATDEQILQSLVQVVRGRPDRVVNLVSHGPNRFVRYWPNGIEAASPVTGPVWHSYELQGLSQAYFVSNVVWELTVDKAPQVQGLWFPAEGGKERHRTWYAPLGDGVPQRFPGIR